LICIPDGDRLYAMKNDSEIIRTASPLGTLQLEFRSGALAACRLVTGFPETPGYPPSAETAKALRELEEYFAGTRRNFSVRLNAEGTPFQLAVWAALRRIPYGEVRTYGEVAAMIGRAGASRAVGGACHANPCLIFTPCHRVVAAHGAGGFGAGMAAKRLLLGIETGESSPFGFEW